MLDVWSIFMAKTGWKEGKPLIGSVKVARNEILEKLLIDGELLSPAVSMKGRMAEIETGLHFRPDAYRLLYESMMDLIQKEWPDQAPEYLSLNFRTWQEAPR